MFIKKIFSSTTFIQIIVIKTILVTLLSNILEQEVKNGFTVTAKPFPNSPNKLRFKRYNINKLDPAKFTRSVAISELLGQLMNKSDTFAFPKSQLLQPIYNGSSLIDHILNDSKLKTNFLSLNDILWQTPSPVLKTDFNVPTTRRVFNYYPIQQQYRQQEIQLPTQSQINNNNNNINNNNVVDVYKKLAADFQTLQQLLAENKLKECTKPPCTEQSGCNKQPQYVCTPAPTILTKNMIIIENICGADGNFTRITLLKRKLCEKKKDIDLPVFPCDRGSSGSNIKLQIKDQDENEIVSKDNRLALKIN